MKIDILKIYKAKVLVAFYNASHPIKFGTLQANSTPMTIEKAQSLLENSSYKKKIFFSSNEVSFLFLFILLYNINLINKKKCLHFFNVHISFYIKLF